MGQETRSPAELLSLLSVGGFVLWGVITIWFWPLEKVVGMMPVVAFLGVVLLLNLR